MTIEHATPIDRVFLYPGRWPNVTIYYSTNRGYTLQLVGLSDGSVGQPSPAGSYKGGSHTREWSPEPLPIPLGAGLTLADVRALASALHSALGRIWNYQAGTPHPASIPNE